MNSAGSVWSFTDACDWTQEEGGNLQIALQVIGRLVEQHGDAMQFLVTDPHETNVGANDNETARIQMQVVVAPGNAEIEHQLSELGLECTSYRPATHEISAGSFAFLGEPPRSEGLDLLKSELSAGFENIPDVKAAYVSCIEHSGDDRIRLALCIESPQSSAELAPTVAALCRSLCDIDILFANDLPKSQWESLCTVAAPFFGR